MKLNEFEKRRAANLIWNAAGNYGISPGFRMYDAKGRADLYWNSIIGAAHRYYDWDRLMEFYQSFHETVDQGVYESLFWLALENSTFEKMRVERPAAAVLREHYAREQLKNFMPSIAESREGWILEGHYRTALGEDSGLPDLVDRKLLKALELPGDLDTEAWIREVGKTLAHAVRDDCRALQDERRDLCGLALSRSAIDHDAGHKARDCHPEFSAGELSKNVVHVFSPFSR